MRKFSFIFLLAVLPLTLSADDAVSGLVITKTNGERVEVAIAHLRSIKTDNYYGTGGTITITANTGKASRGISADALVRITNGIYLITNDCAGLQGTSDTYTAKGITCDQDIELLGGTFQIQMTGTGGKCVKADGTLTIGTEGGEGPQLKATTSGASLGLSSSGGMGGFPGGFPGM